MAQITLTEMYQMNVLTHIPRVHYPDENYVYSINKSDNIVNRHYLQNDNLKFLIHIKIEFRSHTLFPAKHCVLLWYDSVGTR